MKLETSDNIDLGARYDGDFWYVAPTLFYSMFHNKQVVVYDPVVALNYYQSNASAVSKGAELETGVTPAPGLNIFGSFSYNDFTFTNDIRSASNALIMCKGKQIADVPEYMVKMGASYTFKDFNVTPIIRHLSQRFGDILDTERVRAYNVVDLNLGYVMKKAWGFDQVSFGLTFSNLFNEKYIGIITNSQDVTQSLAATYYPGAPFMVIGSVGLKF